MREATGGLTCSVGIAPSRLLAKVASDVDKPNGQYLVPAGRGAIGGFLGPLPLRKLPGIGRVAERVLREALSEAFTLELPSRVREQGAFDSTKKFLWRLTDGALIESVLSGIDRPLQQLSDSALPTKRSGSLQRSS